MNQYLLLSSENVLTQIIPEEDPVFPGVPIEERYTAEFLAQCVVRSDEQIAAQGIHTGMIYDPETEMFNDPPEPEPGPEPEPIPEPDPVPPSPSAWDALEAQVMFTALMTDTLISDEIEEE